MTPHEQKLLRRFVKKVGFALSELQAAIEKGELSKESLKEIDGVMVALDRAVGVVRMRFGLPAHEATVIDRLEQP